MCTNAETHYLDWDLACCVAETLLLVGTIRPYGEYRRKQLNKTGNKFGARVWNLGWNSPFMVRTQSNHSSLPSEGLQGKTLNIDSCQWASKEFTGFDPGVAHSNVVQLIKRSRNADDRYGNLIRIISDPQVLILAYLNIKGKPGNMTPGLYKMDGRKPETLDGIDLNWLLKTSTLLLSGKFTFEPARRQLIPKPGKKEKRPLGIANPRNKIVQKAIQMILEVIYEPMFRSCSYGFRPSQGCHTALKAIQLSGNSWVWAIEGDISKCFDCIPHDTIIKLLWKTIACPATIALIKKSLTAGYKCPETGQIMKPTVGTPQGSVLSPLLANIVLHELDVFIEDVIQKEYNSGTKRQPNPLYVKLANRVKYMNAKMKKGQYVDLDLRNKTIVQMRKIDSKDPMDPKFRRINYFRYADDWLCLTIGSKNEAFVIKDRIAQKLKELGLTLNAEKTHITSLKEKEAKFLGFHIGYTGGNDTPTAYIKSKAGNTFTRRKTNRLFLRVDVALILQKLVKAGFIKRNHLGKLYPISKGGLTVLSHKQILAFYNSKVRGILQYYSCANNRSSLWSIVWMLQASCALTLARKYKLGANRSIGAAMKKFGPLLEYVEKNDKEIKVTRFFKPESLAILPEKQRFNSNAESNIDSLIRKSWLGRLTLSQLNDACVICGSHENVEIHHIRSVKNVRAKYQTNELTFAEWKGAFLRKSMPLCKTHHVALHHGKLTSQELNMLAKYSGKNKVPKITDSD
jgi:group II intron reverse transcriptase/maturase